MWQIASSGDIPPTEMTIRIEAPGQYGHSHVQALTISIEVTSRLTAWRDAQPVQRYPPGALRHLELNEWAALLDAALTTLTQQRLVAAVADLADVEPVLVPPPRILHLVSSREIAGFLPQQLQPIPGAAGSRGAHVQANPALANSTPRSGPGRWLAGCARSRRTLASAEWRACSGPTDGNDASHARAPDLCGHGLCCVQAVPLSPPLSLSEGPAGKGHIVPRRAYVSAGDTDGGGDVALADGRVTGRVMARPVRIGLVFEPSVDMLRFAVEQATLLWGGRYQPFFCPGDLGRTERVSRRLGVDVLAALEGAAACEEVAALDGYQWQGRAEWGPLAPAQDYTSRRLLGPERLIADLPRMPGFCRAGRQMIR